MNWISIGKGALGVVTSLGVSNIVGNIVKSTTPAGLNTFNKITIAVGSFVLGSMIADKTVKYLNEEIDNLLTKKEEVVG